MIFIQLFFEFFKTGLFAIGGGLATLPFLYEIQAKTGWYTINDISNLVAVSESTPGPMGVNMATYTGFTTAGIPGSLIAVAGLVTPSVIIIIIVSNILDKFKTNKYVQYAMYGLRAASVALITVACLRVAQLAFLHMDAYAASGVLKDLFNPLAIGFGIVLFIVFKITKKHPIYYIIASAVIGIVLMM